MKEFKDLARLQASIEWSIKELEVPRKKRYEAIRQYVGSHYSEGGADNRVPVNFLELAVTIYVRQLAARAPQAMISSGIRELRPYAKSMELAVNQIPEEIDLGTTLRNAVVEAMFSYAIVKVGICNSGQSVDGCEYGDTFADLVSVDDHFFDMRAKTRAAMQFEGNDYWVSLEDARNMYQGDDPTELMPEDYTVNGTQGESRAESASLSNKVDLFNEVIQLRDVWIPRDKQVVTYAVKSKKQVRVVDWKGPKAGPYHMLSFIDVPGNLLPLPPIALWRDLHELSNILFRKLGRQADAKKSVMLFGGGDEGGVNALKNAKDGEGIRYAGQKPETQTVGGIDAASMAFAIQLKSIQSYMAGNLDSLGGLAPQADTLGQDKLLAESSSALLNGMRDRTLEFTQAIFRDIVHYEWNDPVKERRISKSIPGTDISISSVWSKPARKGEFKDYKFEIDVYSMQDDSPSSKMQKIGIAMERFVIPLMPQIEKDGGRIDSQKLVSTVSQLNNIPELNDIVTFGSPPPPMMAPGGANNAPQGGSPGMPTNTTRNYVRSSRPGPTPSGADAAMSQVLMGAGVQQSQMNQIGRSAG